jgi:GTP cyclohydrolase II
MSFIDTVTVVSSSPSHQLDCGTRCTHLFAPEGRGIGLFEKIKSYELQRQGHDTYEANIMLVMPPTNARTKKPNKRLLILALRVSALLTNNPLKVEEMTKLGLDVTERVHLSFKPTNRTKRT